tara:strand:+ start:424 stop:1761 length:1338 start_codon:yes stop_codon:yes gene_type:complete
MAHPQTPPTFNAVTTGSDEYSVELNDANVGTLAWKSSRYNGSKTITAVLNKYTKGIDVSVGKGAAAQKYSRNIYLGNSIVGMDEGGEDDLLLNFPAFSYATTLKYFTVNGDNSISNDTVESKPDDFNSRRGFYRSFYEDFPEKSSCKIIINDVSTKTNLKDSYEIYFNSGQLENLIGVQFPSNGFSITQADINTDGIPSYIISQASTKFSAVIKFFNQNELRNFYTGSLAEIEGDSANLTVHELSDFISPFFSNYKTPSEYIGDKRMFLSFCTQSGVPQSPSKGTEYTPLRTITQGAVSESLEGTLGTKNLSELSTAEVSSISTLGIPGQAGSNIKFSFTNQKNIGQKYISGTTSSPSNKIATPTDFATGSLVLTKTEDATPSLLINLPKNEHLPDGIGVNGFVIIPDNLHPHIKKNLTHFLAKAGVPLGVDTIPALDNTFEKLS